MIKVTYYNEKNECYKLTIKTANLDKAEKIIEDYILQYNLWIDDIQISGGIGNYIVDVYHSRFIEPLWKTEQSPMSYIEEDIPTPTVFYIGLFPHLYYPEKKGDQWIWKR